MRVSFDEAIARGWIPAEDKPKAAAGDKPPRKREREGEEQTSLVATFEKIYPQYADLLIHIPNGGYRKNRFEGFRLKKQGVKSGVSDLFLPVARGGYFGLWIEFKAAPPFDAAVTESQAEWLEKMQRQGYAAHLCKGEAAAMEVFAKYLALQPTLAHAA